MKNNKLTKVDVWRFTVAFPTLLTFLPGLEERCSLTRHFLAGCVIIIVQHCINIADHPTPLEVSNYFPGFVKSILDFYRCSVCEKIK